MGLPWIADGVTEYESQVVDYFADLAKENLALVERLMGLPWIADGVTEYELQAVRYVGGLIQEHPLLAGAAARLAVASRRASPSTSCWYLTLWRR